VLSSDQSVYAEEGHSS